MPRKKRMYDELRRRGGRVADQDEWRELGRACGYSARRAGRVLRRSQTVDGPPRRRLARAHL